MANRLRDVMTEPLTMEYVNRRLDEGWTLSAVEWVKPQVGQPAPDGALDDIPYGQRISADCKHLIDDPLEMDALYTIYEKVIAGWRPTQIANELNERGRRTRAGLPWTPNAVFDLLPRLVELGPKLQSRPDWPARRASLEIIA
jgi:hypothetical protein